MSEASVYPGTLDTFTDQEAKQDKAAKAIINKIQNAIEAIQAELGLDPAGSAVDLVTRLFVCIGNNGAIRQGTSFPDDPVEGQIFYRTDLDLTYIWDGSAWDALNTPVDGTITQAKLSTSTGSTSGNLDTSGSGADLDLIVMNAYSFFPNVYTQDASVIMTGHTTNNVDQTSRFGLDNQNLSNSKNYAVYWRYVTASDPEPWVFVLRNKSTGEIRRVWESKDHIPSPDPLNNPIFDPFGEYDKTKFECILIDNSSLASIAKNEFSASKIRESFEFDTPKAFPGRVLIELDPYGNRPGVQIGKKIKTSEAMRLLTGIESYSKKLLQVDRLPAEIKYGTLKLKV